MGKWLDTVKEITESDGDRRRDYGHPLTNFLRIAILWCSLFEKYVSPVDVANAMILTKIARNQNTFKEDNYIDTMGYANCVEAMDTRLKEMKYPEGVKHLENKNVGFLTELLSYSIRYEEDLEDQIQAHIDAHSAKYPDYDIEQDLVRERMWED